jgi:hypothetical protein
MMDFTEYLNHYCSEVGCTSSELSETSGLSVAVISRYRSGSRRPDPNREQLRMLAVGIHNLSLAKDVSEISEQDILKTLKNSLLQDNRDLAAMTRNLDILLSVLNVNMNHLAHYLKYDTSFISRIRSGQRKPADPQQFIDDVCSYIVKNYNSDTNRESIRKLLNVEDAPRTPAESIDLLKQWLNQSTIKDYNSISGFIKKMDEFNLNEYIRAVHFDELKVPSAPFYHPRSRDYIGIQEIKNGELDFLKAAVLSKSMEPVLLCSDMPMEDMSGDDFPKKYLYGIAVMLKKGLHLNVVHNLNRPFNELLLGLEGWMPMYMTGQITPYYLRNAGSEVYCHFHNVSGSAALIGECIVGHHDDARFHLTAKTEDIAYYQREADYILEKAVHLMDIYTVKEKNVLEAFLNHDASSDGSRKSILSLPPLYTIEYSLLLQILNQNNVSNADQEAIISSYESQCRRISAILENDCEINDELSIVTEDEFKQYPAVLSIANSFCEKNIFYTYEQYLKHVSLTKEFSQKNPSYSVHLSFNPGFRNIQVTIHCGRWAMFSKGTNPAIHFVTKHPKILEGTENLSFLIKD